MDRKMAEELVKGGEFLKQKALDATNCVKHTHTKGNDSPIKQQTTDVV